MRTAAPINDCLGHPDGSMVDNIEDVDIVVGFLAETTRPHGFAISETQFHIFILNASRRLFSDRFFTSSFRPEFYTTFGLDWVMNNGPGEPVMEEGEPNGHEQQVLPLKRVLLRTMPELEGRAEKRRQRLRPVGTRPRRVLFARLEAARRREGRPGIQAIDGIAGLRAHFPPARFAVIVRHE